MIAFGYFKGLPYERSNEEFETYRHFKNSIGKDKIIAHIETLDPGLTTLPSYDFFYRREAPRRRFLGWRFRFSI